MKKCIILSYGPVPVPEYYTVEGGGLRCWGLAQGIKSNAPDLGVTVAFHESYKKNNLVNFHEGIYLSTWNMQNLATIIQEYDCIIASYCMGDLSVAVVDNIRTDQQLILDCYVPIFVEVSARDTNNIEQEYKSFHSDLGRWIHVLRRGDVYLCASDAQKAFYKGVVSMVGKINPVTYGEESILVVPYGIPREGVKQAERPLSKLVPSDKTKKILWFGGVYPWFDIRVLVDAVVLLNKRIDAVLVVVGAKNPFNNHPDFTRKYQELLDYVEAIGAKKHVIFQEWVPFQHRGDWYLDNDIAVVINKVGHENELAWRTRLVDFMWADLPVFTNGGDPLGEILISHNAAVRAVGLAKDELADNLFSVLNDPERLEVIRQNVRLFKENFYWDAVTKILTNYILKGFRPKDKFLFGKVETVQVSGGMLKVRHFATKMQKLPNYIQKNGYLNLLLSVRTVAQTHIKKIVKAKKQKVLFVSHQLDYSGAPYVFLDLVSECVSKYGPQNIEFHTFNPALKDNIVQLNRIGITPKIHSRKDAILDLTNCEVVVLNTAAHSNDMRNSLFSSLERGAVKKLIWYIHEDEPEAWFDKSEKNRISKLMMKDKIIIYTLALGTVRNYRDFFGIEKNILSKPYRLNLPNKVCRVRSEDEFSRLRFIMLGGVGDGRKGQLVILFAFKFFKERYYTKNPSHYRDFELVFVGMGDDFISRQIRLCASGMLSQHFIGKKNLSRTDALEEVDKANITICYSIRECLPLFVFEGMASGHPILRNSCSGVDEQLINGENGFLLSEHDFDQVVNVIETMLNLNKITNSRLAEMSKVSHEIAMKNASNSQEELLSIIFGSISER